MNTAEICDARTTLVNIRTFLLNYWDFRTISNFRTISGQLCNFRNFRTAGSPEIVAFFNGGNKLNLITSWL